MDTKRNNQGGAQTKKQKAERGRDVSAPVKFIELNGQRYELVFNNKAARVAEDVYEQVYGNDVGYAEILRLLTLSKYKAIMAVFYGALLAGGTDMSWEEFDEAFKLDSIPGVKEAILKGIVDALPKVEEPKDEEGEEENP